MARQMVLFGGTFDPVHVGHLIVARSIAESCGFERITFVPAAQAPHKGLAATAAADRLAMLRLAWRLGNPPPTLPAGTPHWERKLAAFAHWVLYALIFAVPLSGWWVSDASRVPFKAFFLVPMPDFIATDRALQEAAAEVHEALTMTLLVVVLVHIAAALRHHFLLHDEVLSRMLTGRHSGD